MQNARISRKSGNWVGVYNPGTESGYTILELSLGIQSRNWVWVYNLGTESGYTIWELSLGIQSGNWVWVYNPGTESGYTIWEQELLLISSPVCSCVCYPYILKCTLYVKYLYDIHTSHNKTAKMKKFTLAYIVSSYNFFNIQYMYSIVYNIWFWFSPSYVYFLGLNIEKHTEI